MAQKSKQWAAIIMMIALFAMIAFVTNLCSPMAVIVQNQFGASELQSQIDYEQKRADEIDNLKKNVNSDEYIEKMAREKLGMIRKDEIVFIDVTSEDE